MAVSPDTVPSSEAELRAILSPEVDDLRRRIEDFTERTALLGHDDRMRLLDELCARLEEADQAGKGMARVTPGGKTETGSSAPGSRDGGSCGGPDGRLVRSSALALGAGIAYVEAVLLEDDYDCGQISARVAAERIRHLRATMARMIESMTVQDGMEGCPENLNAARCRSRFLVVGSMLEELGDRLPAILPGSVGGGDVDAGSVPDGTTSSRVLGVPGATASVNTGTCSTVPKAPKPPPLPVDARTRRGSETPGTDVIHQVIASRYRPVLPLTLIFAMLLVAGWVYARYENEPYVDRSGEPLDPFMSSEWAMQGGRYEEAAAGFRALMVRKPEYENTARLRLCLALSAMERRSELEAELDRLDCSRLPPGMVSRLDRELGRLGIRRKPAELRAPEQSKPRDGAGVVDRAARDRKTQDECTGSGEVRKRLEADFSDVRLLFHQGRSLLFRARHLKTDMDCAVKLVRLEAPPTGSRSKSLMAEAQALAGLEHGGLARILESHEGYSGYSMCATEFVEGDPLDLVIARREMDGDYDLIVRLMLAELDALSVLHEAGVIHRNIKPEHIILRNGKNPVFISFGLFPLMALADLGRPVLQADPAYMAPELLAGGAWSRASDVYSLGMTFYEMIAGVIWSDEKTSARNPFGRVRPLHEVVPSCPAKLAGLVMACIAGEPSARPGNCSAIVAALEDIV